VFAIHLVHAAAAISRSNQLRNQHTIRSGVRFKPLLFPRRYYRLILFCEMACGSCSLFWIFSRFWLCWKEAAPQADRDPLPQARQHLLSPETLESGVVDGH
jgi:hypothetical protein